MKNKNCGRKEFDMKKGLVSIITPCYNGEKYIAETIDSVIAQSYNNWEMIIVDDGSKDNSAQIVKNYMNKEPRIKLIQQGNGGSSAARNNGIRNAEGQYMALLDADDLWNSDFLEKQIKLMNESNCICVYSSYKLIDKNSKEIGHPVIAKDKITEKDMMIRDYIGCLTGLYNMEKYGKVYLHEELKSLKDDYAFWLDVVKLEKVAYGNREVLASYRVLSNSATSNKKKMIIKQWQFYRQYLKLNVPKSMFNIIVWGINGLKKFRNI